MFSHPARDRTTHGTTALAHGYGTRITATATALAIL